MRPMGPDEHKYPVSIPWPAYAGLPIYIDMFEPPPSVEDVDAKPASWTCWSGFDHIRKISSGHRGQEIVRLGRLHSNMRRGLFWVLYIPKPAPQIFAQLQLNVRFSST